MLINKCSYSLQIYTESNDIRSKINNVLNVKSNFPNDSWGIEIIEKETDNYVDFINIFLDILENKYSFLEDIGISRNYITIWAIYEYKEQCNIEFEPKDLERLGKNGIKLCISCWENL